MALLKKDPIKDLTAKIGYDRENAQRTAPMRDCAWEFYRGNHFAYVNAKNSLITQSSGGIGVKAADKPTHRARQARNLIFDVVLREASNATQQVPSYQVPASTNDPEDASAASLSEKVLRFGYGRWSVRDATIDAVTHAVVGGEAFAWVYFDTTIGPFLEDAEGAVGTGDVRCRIFGGNQVYWASGLQFQISPYHIVEVACDPESVQNMPGFTGGKLTPDADTRAMAMQKSSRGKLVVVTHYLERPCPEYPEGKWKVLANNREIIPERPYPGTGEDPVLRQLIYAPDPDSDRSLGLVQQIIDPQRTINDAENKAVEWKNHMLNPQWVVAPGQMKKQRRTDEPGKIYEIPDPARNFKSIDVPPIPDGLFTMGDRAKDDLLRIAGQQDIPTGVEAAKAIQAIIEQNRARSGMFTASLAKFISDIGHDCLVQVQENYTEERTLQIKGDFGWESIEDFKGAQLRNQVDVRVLVDSIAPQTRQEREQRIMTFVQLDAIDPDEAMAAIETGTTEGLIRSFAQDQGRVGRVIQQLKQGPAALGAMPMLPTGRLEQVPGGPLLDPMTGQQQVNMQTGEPEVEMVDGDAPEMAPAWMPRYSDDLKIWRTTFEDWLKTEDYERQPPDVQDACGTIYAAILKLQAQKDAEAAQAQTEQAEGLGMANAAMPQVKPTPSLPAVNGGN